LTKIVVKTQFPLVIYNILKHKWNIFLG